MVIIGLAVLAGCSSSTEAPKDSGIVTEGIYNCGGISDRGCPGVLAAGMPSKPISGTVVVSTSGHTVARAHVRDGESYRLSLQPGTYTVSTGSLASTVRAVVAAGRTTTADVVVVVVDQIP